MTTVEPPECINCLHWIKDWKCDAFPNGIPDDIMYGDMDHRSPYKGDNGFQFEEREAE